MAEEEATKKAQEEANKKAQEERDKKCASAACNKERLPMSNYCQDHQPYGGGGGGSEFQ
jgi:hypothetical protein